MKVSRTKEEFQELFRRNYDDDPQYELEWSLGGDGEQ